MWYWTSITGATKFTKTTHCSSTKVQPLWPCPHASAPPATTSPAAALSDILEIVLKSRVLSLITKNGQVNYLHIHAIFLLLALFWLKKLPDIFCLSIFPPPPKQIKVVHNLVDKINISCLRVSGILTWMINTVLIKEIRTWAFMPSPVRWQTRDTRLMDVTTSARSQAG